NPKAQRFVRRKWRSLLFGLTSESAISFLDSIGFNGIIEVRESQPAGQVQLQFGSWLDSRMHWQEPSIVSMGKRYEKADQQAGGDPALTQLHWHSIVLVFAYTFQSSNGYGIRLGSC